MRLGGLQDTMLNQTYAQTKKARKRLLSYCLDLDNYFHAMRVFSSADTKG